MTTAPTSSDPPSSKDYWCININEDVDWVQTSIYDILSDGKIYDRFLELHKAAVKGDVDKALRLFGTNNYREILRSPITQRYQTILHVATGAKQTHFVEKMLRHIEEQELELPDEKGNNAFCIAAMAGAKEIARMMLQKNPALLRIRGGGNKTPLYLAALFGQRDMASYLYKEYEGSKVEDVEDIFYASIHYYLYDLALELQHCDETLAVVQYEEHGTALHMLAQSPSAFASRGMGLIDHQMDLSTQALKLLECLWQKVVEQKGMNVGKYMRENKKLLFDAAKLGNSKFLGKLISFYPDLARELDENGRTIFHIAVLHRHAAILNLMNEIGFDKQFIATLPDRDGNNLLHLAATYSYNQRPVSTVPGAALEMQQELKTFKEVALLILPSYREMKNKEGLTPREVFTRDHKNLLENGEKWMKDTASSCMLVATIITTVVFAAGFSVPGDYDDEGIPNQLKRASLFSSFSLVNAVALLCSSISTLMFLSILVSRYEEENFLISLPLKLTVGLLTLFISITTMMISFSLSFFLAYEDRSKIIPTLICSLLLAPAILFLYLERQLFKDMIYSSLRSRFSCKPIDY